jgi:AmmeMemoRadiSam system protein B
MKMGGKMRYAAVAGQFYSGNKDVLITQIGDCFLSPLGPQKLPSLKKGKREIKGLVVPHAGYVYSGPVAAHSYLSLADDGFPQAFIIIGPNHTGYGSGVALTDQDFNTPLGDVIVDKELARELRRGIVDDDISAHRHEHSIEVQLPFLQYIEKDFKFVPICMAMQDYKASKEVGKIIKDAIKGKDIVVIATTDFSHYVPQAVAQKKDRMAIDAILELNSKKLYNTVVRNNISMCGYGPVMAMIEAVDGTKAELLKYGTSGDVQPMHDVVGYGAIVIK